MKLRLAFIFLTAISSALLHAEEEIPLIRPDEQRTIDLQQLEIQKALTPVLTDSAKSTVRIWAGRKRIAYGTVIADGDHILTKWSEVAMAEGTLRIQVGDGALMPATVTGVYRDEDLALLEFEGNPLTPVKWQESPLELGAFLAAPQPNGRVAAFGIVSVLERNLRETNQAFIGIGAARAFAGPGVKIQTIKEKSPAAEAGLKIGDVILELNNRKISGLLELKNALTNVTPGQQIKLKALIAGQEKDIQVEVAERPETPDFSNARLQQMERMGGAISQVRSDFSNVIQSDMRPSPNQIGGPVTNLKGEVVGITMARADRTRSFIMPASAVIDLLETKPLEPALAMQEATLENQQRVQASRRPMVPQARPTQTTEERMMSHLREMQELMEHMEKELESLDYGAEER